MNWPVQDEEEYYSRALGFQFIFRNVKGRALCLVPFGAGPCFRKRGKREVKSDCPLLGKHECGRVHNTTHFMQEHDAVVET